MPLLEKITEDVTGLKRGRRFIMGESMGGFNTAQLVMKYPGEFDRAALLCPAAKQGCAAAGNPAREWRSSSERGCGGAVDSDHSHLPTFSFPVPVRPGHLLPAAADCFA